MSLTLRTSGSELSLSWCCECADPPAATFIPGVPLVDRPGVRVLEQPIFARLMGYGPLALLIHGFSDIGVGWVGAG